MTWPQSFVSATRGWVPVVILILAGSAFAHGGNYRVGGSGNFRPGERGPRFEAPPPGRFLEVSPEEFRARPFVPRMRIRPRTPEIVQWSTWWFLNQGSILRERARVLRSAPGHVIGHQPLGESVKRSTILPLIRVALSDADPEVRAAAVIALGKVGATEDGARLTRALRDEDPRVRASAALALGMGEDRTSLPLLVDILGDHARARVVLGRQEKGVLPRTRSFAAVAIGLIARAGPPSANSDLIATLLRIQERRVEPSLPEEVRSVALVPFSMFDAWEAVPVLEETARTRRNDVSIRAEAIRGMRCLGRAPHRPRLRPITTPGRNSPRQNESGRPAAWNEARLLLEEELRWKKTPHLVGAFAIPLGLMSSHESLPLLRTKLAHRRISPRARRDLILAVGLLGARESRPLMRSMVVNNGRVPASRECILALGLCGDHEDLPLLFEVLDRTGIDRAYRGAAARAISYLDDRRALPPLVRRVRDGAPSTRALSVAVLGMLASRPRYTDVASLLEGRDVQGFTTSLAEIFGLL